jgi:phosphonopyruvate decarboxylase
MNVKEDIRKNLENKFARLLINVGFNFVSGVPCAAQKYIIAYFSNNPKIQHIPATRESEALGITVGAYLAGKKPIVYMQNSGLMNSINDITSLLIPYKIPILFLVTWRGAPGEDAPQHIINGQSMIKVLDAIGIPAQILTKENMRLIIQSSKRWLKEKQTPMIILIIRDILK